MVLLSYCNTFNQGTWYTFPLVIYETEKRVSYYHIVYFDSANSIRIYIKGQEVKLTCTPFTLTPRL